MDLLGAGGTDDRRRDLGAAEHPGQREFGHRETGRLGDRPQAADRLQDCVVQQAIHGDVHVAVGRPRVGWWCLPRAVLAGQHALGERRPDDLGDAVAAHSPNSSASGARGIEYWGWEETNNSGPARSIAAWSCSVVH